MITKICNKCGEEKELTKEFFFTSKYNDGFVARCKICRNADAKKWKKYNAEKMKILSKISAHKTYLKYKDKIIKKSTEYNKKNKDKLKITRKKHRDNNPEQYKGYYINQKGNKQKYRDKLYDSYIKAKLYRKGFKYKDITDELIETQRIITKIKRHEKHKRIT
jgi:hypothetical protein